MRSPDLANSFSEPLRFHDIARALRFRICLLDPAKPHTLYENRLAEEFGVSRTPIRQALQRLAYEHLIETHTGVGNVVPALEEAKRPCDFAVLGGLLNIAATTANPDILVALRIEVAGMKITMDDPEIKLPDTTELLALHSRLADWVGTMAGNRILAQAIFASHWRVLRWIFQARLQANKTDIKALTALINALSLAETAPAALGLIADFYANEGELIASVMG
jgi:DNA-binding GntR family transcriptional regulator